MNDDVPSAKEREVQKSESSAGFKISSTITQHNRNVAKKVVQPCVDCRLRDRCDK